MEEVKTVIEPNLKQTQYNDLYDGCDDWTDIMRRRYEMNKRTGKLAVYGSLRSGEYNNTLSDSDRTTIRLKGLELADFGSYPGAFVTNNTNKSLVVELYDAPSEDYEDGIDGMEFGAGYYPDFFEYEGETYKIYLYSEDDEDILMSPKVEDGDWCNRERNGWF